MPQACRRPGFDPEHGAEQAAPTRNETQGLSALAPLILTQQGAKLAIGDFLPGLPGYVVAAEGIEILHIKTVQSPNAMHRCAEIPEVDGTNRRIAKSLKKNCRFVKFVFNSTFQAIVFINIAYNII
jgi:hypothetical protein